jgi:cytochrome oxidase Cu insertion factor (SCO1/SenC/PrrC family)
MASVRERWLTRRASVLAVLATLSLVSVNGAQAPQRVDTSSMGPKVGDTIPPFDGVDQFGKRQTLDTARGPNGLMLVFFRAADW